jgi:flavin reductase (DIM6/NTAB) family NADH-FMN oxidoreductase RutF
LRERVLSNPAKHAEAPDPKAFREVLGLFATGVAVIATDIEGEVHAMTANAVSSLSLDPLLVLFCAAKRARFSQPLARAHGYSVNFLRHEQEALSTYFAGFWAEAAPPKYRFVATGGVPRLEGSLASLMCTKHAVFDGGDHWIVTLAVRGLHRGVEPLRPLLFYRGQYRRIDPHDGTSAPDLANTADEPVQMYYHDR